MTSASDSGAPDDLELPRPPGAFRRYFTEHPFVVDCLVAGVYLIPAIASGIHQMLVHPGWQAAAHVTIAGIGGAALFARRLYPRTVFAIAIAVLVASVFVGRDADFVPVMFALYALAAFRSVRSAWIGYVLTAAATIFALAASAILAEVTVYAPLATTAVPSGFAVLAFCVVAVFLGSNVGNRRRYLTALIDRARQLARERDQQAELATAAERSRIAREMHDIVSHSLTVMIALADGSARVATASPERSAETMRLVAETGRGALGDMRRLLGVLRAGDGEVVEHAPQPGLGELGELVERFREAGLPVRITVIGTAPSDIGQQLTVFRIVQEALTNALRHASLATSVAVVIDLSGDAIDIAVEDDATVRTTAAPGSGSGLLGLRERLALYGGTLEAGPRHGGGWRLHARMPTIAAADDDSTTGHPVEDQTTDPQERTA